MTLSIWRYAHLSLAILSSAFLVILSITGVILAVDAINEKSPAYKVENFDNITLAQVLPTLREHYFEIIEVKIESNSISQNNLVLFSGLFRSLEISLVP